MTCTDASDRKLRRFSLQAYKHELEAQIEFSRRRRVQERQNQLRASRDRLRHVEEPAHSSPLHTFQSRSHYQGHIDNSKLEQQRKKVAVNVCCPAI